MGIPIVIHPSWLVAFGLMSGVLAAGLLPAESPGWERATYWVVGVATSAVLFASLLLHELAHCAMARRHGLLVRRVTLFVFGGIAEIDGEPDSARVALRIAMAGPIASLLLAASFAGMAMLAPHVDLVTAPAAVLARLNVTLALFNLLPGHPLDGGRMLEAIVWWITGDRRRAAMVSAEAGRWVSLGIIALGVFLLIGGAVVGIWLVVLGALQHTAALATAERALLERALAGVTVRQAMRDPGVRVPPAFPLERLVAEKILGGGERCVLVADGDRLHGIVTLRDVHAVPRERWDGLAVGAVMRPVDRLVTTDPDEPMVVAVRKMDEARVAQLPVTSGGRLVGLLTREQVLHLVRARLEPAAGGGTFNLVGQATSAR
jgi:Zn-dependent protease/CBS domain-containing protein